jgi:Domain of unknown function (DUF4386)
MTSRSNARIAGVAFLLYIVTGLTAMVLSRNATAGEGTPEKLASIARHAGEFRVSLVLVFVGCFCALALAVTLCSITREVDPDLAMMILVCRAAEGVVGALSLQRATGRLWLATASGAAAPDPAAAAALGAVLLKLPAGMAVPATFFAVGSAIFSYLLVRGRLVPAWLAWTGVVASLILIVCLPFELAGILPAAIGQAMWIPMLLFEVTVGFWLIAKGVAARAV